MAQKAEYRSAIRSREAIRAALLGLLEERPMEKVTVTELVRRADVNRSTFYAHYPDIYGVVEEMEDEAMAAMGKVLSELQNQGFVHDPTPLLLEMGAVFEADKDRYRILVEADSSVGLLRKLQDAFAESMLTSTSIVEPLRSHPAYPLRVHYFAAGYANLLRLWLLGQLDASIEDISREVGTLISTAARQLIDELGLE